MTLNGVVDNCMSFSSVDNCFHARGVVILLQMCCVQCENAENVLVILSDVSEQHVHVARKTKENSLISGASHQLATFIGRVLQRNSHPTYLNTSVTHSFTGWFCLSTISNVKQLQIIAVVTCSRDIIHQLDNYHIHH